jgi:hypothetical protein
VDNLGIDVPGEQLGNESECGCNRRAEPWNVGKFNCF